MITIWMKLITYIFKTLKIIYNYLDNILKNTYAKLKIKSNCI